MSDFFILFSIITGLVIAWLLIGLIIFVVVDALMQLPDWWIGKDDIHVDVSGEGTRGMICFGPLLLVIAVVIGLIAAIHYIGEQAGRIKWPSIPTIPLTFRIKARKQPLPPFVK